MPVFSPLSPEESTLCKDFAFETGIPKHIVEKDFYTTRAIALVAALPVSPYFTRIFCGGTCLSKAYGLLSRMSEDVDFKLVPTDQGLALTDDVRKERLADFYKEVLAALKQEGVADDKIKHKQSESKKYLRFEIALPTDGVEGTALRDSLQIEFIYTSLQNESVEKPVQLMTDIKRGTQNPIAKVKAISVPEALAEKMIAFPRRLAEHHTRATEGELTPFAPGGRDGMKWDKNLVRHVYDVVTIAGSNPEFLNEALMLPLLEGIIKKDKSDFSSHEAFINNPRKELMRALKIAHDDERLANQYADFVSQMIYESERAPAWLTALGEFSNHLDRLTLAIEQRNDLGQEI